MKKFSSFLIVLLLMLASFTAGMEYPRGDVSQDGQVNINDVTCLIDYLLTGTWPEDTVTPIVEGEYVDLGLPSGTLWATCNIGANAPEEYGDYFAWGETEPKDYYHSNTYKWFVEGSGIDYWITKYCNDSTEGYNGFVDNKMELDPEDDAAYVNWGPSWRMPTKEQQDELRESCTWNWTTLNGVNGCQVTGPNGNTIFLPAAGFRKADLLTSDGTNGYYWSRTLYPYTSFGAYYLRCFPSNIGWDYTRRSTGFTVRAVRNVEN